MGISFYTFVSDCELIICALVPVYASIHDLEAIKKRMARMKAELLSEVVTVGVCLFDLLYIMIPSLAPMSMIGVHLVFMLHSFDLLSCIPHSHLRSFINLPSIHRYQQCAPNSTQHSRPSTV